MPSNFGPISIPSLNYTPKSLLITLIYFLCLPPLVVSVCGHGDHARGTQTRGGGGHAGDDFQVSVLEL